MALKSKWRRLAAEDVKTVLAQDEIEKLQQISVEGIDDVIQMQLDQVADTFRAAFSAKGWPVDIREHYLPSSYFMYSLALARYYIWTRFPNSKEIALDEPRQKLFDAALEMLKSPTLPTFDPDYSDDPELSGDTSLTAYDDAALTLPWQRILPQPFACGFAHPYIYDTQLSSK